MKQIKRWWKAGKMVFAEALIFCMLQSFVNVIDNKENESLREMTVEADLQMEQYRSCESDTDLPRILSMTSQCELTSEEVISSLIGLTAAPLWLVGRLLMLSARRDQLGRNEELFAFVKWSLLPHCLADVISCAGAVMSVQLFPQVVFAGIVLSVNCGVAMLIALRHLLSNRTKYDMHGNHLVNSSCAVTLCGRYSFQSCSFMFVMAITFLASDVSAGRDVTFQTAESLRDDVVSTMQWWEVTGEVMGGVACFGHWMASLYDVISMYKDRPQHQRSQTVAVVLMMAGNSAYVVTVLWRPIIYWRRSLPWTLARVGLLGMNAGLFRKKRLKGRHSCHEADLSESMLSSSTGSDADSQHDALWDSWCSESLYLGATKTNFRKDKLEQRPYDILCNDDSRSGRKDAERRGRGIKGEGNSLHLTGQIYLLEQFQPVTPAFPVMQCLGQGRSLQPPNQTMAYDLLQSTETSCSRTAEQDTEQEFEANFPAHFATFIPQRDISLAHLSALTPEARHDRIVKWVEKSSLDDDQRHALDAPEEHAQYRQHSGSFSQARCTSGLPKSRMNSAIF